MKIITTAVVITFLTIALFFYVPPFPHVLQKNFLSIAAPLWSVGEFFKGGMSAIGTYIQAKEALEEENRLLKEALQQNEVKFLKWDLLAEENRLLKERLGRSVSSGENTRAILAVILSKPNQTLYDTLVLDVGSADGVSVGDRVVAYGDVLIGTMENISTHASIAKLFSSPGEEIEVAVGKEALSGIARGAGGGNFEMIFPRGLDVREGDTVFFPGLHAEIVGVVEKIKVRPADAFQKVLFKLPVNFFDLRFVEVILSGMVER